MENINEIIEIGTVVSSVAEGAMSLGGGAASSGNGVSGASVGVGSSAAGGVASSAAGFSPLHYIRVMPLIITDANANWPTYNLGPYEALNTLNAKYDFLTRSYEQVTERVNSHISHFQTVSSDEYHSAYSEVQQFYDHDNTVQLEKSAKQVRTEIINYHKQGFVNDRSFRSNGQVKGLASHFDQKWLWHKRYWNNTLGFNFPQKPFDG